MVACRTVVEALQGLLFQGDVAKIVMHEAYDPDACMDLLYASRREVAAARQ